MSCKIPLNNGGIGVNETQWVKNGSFMDGSIKLAGEEAKDRLYEPKQKKKLFRVLTVVAYVFCVSLAAIMLSLYYVFLWNGNENIPYSAIEESKSIKCDNIITAEKYEAPKIEDFKDTDATLEENTTTMDDDISSEDEVVLERDSNVMKNFIFSKHRIND